jgi:hypothetical protein
MVPFSVQFALETPRIVPGAGCRFGSSLFSFATRVAATQQGPGSRPISAILAIFRRILPPDRATIFGG